MHGQEIQIALRQPAHRRLDGGADIEQFHVEEDLLAVLVLQLLCQRKPAAGQHPQPDLVEGNRVTDALGQLQPCQRIADIQCHDQPVIHHPSPLPGFA